MHKIKISYIHHDGSHLCRLLVIFVGINPFHHGFDIFVFVNFTFIHRENGAKDVATKVCRVCEALSNFSAVAPKSDRPIISNTVHEPFQPHQIFWD